MKWLKADALCALGLIAMAAGAWAQETVITNGGVTVRSKNGQVTHINNNGVVTGGRRGRQPIRGVGRTLNSNGQHLTFNAADSPVIVNGNQNVLTVRGNCPRLVVNGNGNTLYLTRVNTIEAEGNDNRIRYATSPRRGGRAVVSNLGTNNRITRQ